MSDSKAGEAAAATSPHATPDASTAAAAAAEDDVAGAKPDDALADSGSKNATAKDAAAASFLDDDAAERNDVTQGEEDEDEGDSAELDTVAANDVKNIILQVLSPYFDDDVGTAAEVAGVDALGGAASGAGSPNMANRDVSGLPHSSTSPSSPVGQEEDAGEDVAQRYDHVKAEMWIARICDGIMERLVGLGKPFKFVVHTMIMRKCGAGLHVCSSCYYAPTDGWLSHSHDLSAHLYAVVTVYWCAM